jgi:hypothetical protein
MSAPKPTDELSESAGHKRRRSYFEEYEASGRSPSKVVVESGIPSAPSQEDRHSRIEGDKPVCPPESEKSDLNKKPEIGLIARQTGRPEPRARRPAVDDNGERLPMKNTSGMYTLPEPQQTNSNRKKRKFQAPRTRCGGRRESTIDEYAKDSPSGKVIFAQPDVFRCLDIDETAKKIGTLEILILEWTNLTQEELAEETDS